MDSMKTRAPRNNQGSPKVAGRSNTLFFGQSWQLLCLCELLQPFNIIDENGFGFAVGRLSPRLSSLAPALDVYRLVWCRALFSLLPLV